MTAEERRLSIIKAAQRAYAQYGFFGTTTRDLAREAGVSEALLFKHFATKDDIYFAMLEQWFPKMSKDNFPFDESELRPSKKVAAVTYMMAWKVLGALERGDDEELVRQRLLFQSLLNDGKFARLVFDRLPKEGRDEINDALNCAVKDGDCKAPPFPFDISMMFTVNMQSAVLLYMTHEPHLHGISVGFLDLVDYFMWYAMRGMGFHDHVIASCLEEVKNELDEEKLRRF